MIRRGLPQTIVDQRSQLALIEWLFEPQVRDFVEERAGARGARSARQEDDAMRLVRMDPHELGVEIHAGHVGHHEIAQDDVEGLAGADPFEGIQGTGGGRNVVFAVQVSSYRAEYPWFVID